jgi:hypothetical protein
LGFGVLVWVSNNNLSFAWVLGFWFWFWFQIATFLCFGIGFWGFKKKFSLVAHQKELPQGEALLDGCK